MTPPTRHPFAIGESVIIDGQQAGTVTERVIRKDGEFLLVSVGDSRVEISIVEAPSRLRAILSRSEARLLMAFLRSHGRGWALPHPGEAQEVLEQGSLRERATLLHGLYTATRPLTPAESDAEARLEHLVLSDVALVLGENREALSEELHRAHPRAGSEDHSSDRN